MTTMLDLLYNDIVLSILYLFGLAAWVLSAMVDPGLDCVVQTQRRSSKNSQGSHDQCFQGIHYSKHIFFNKFKKLYKELK